MPVMLPVAGIAAAKGSGAGEETKAEIEERDTKEQEAFAMLLKATGLDPESLEASLLENRLRRDTELRKLLDLPFGFDKSFTDLVAP